MYRQEPIERATCCLQLLSHLFAVPEFDRPLDDRREVAHVTGATDQSPHFSIPIFISLKNNNLDVYLGRGLLPLFTRTAAAGVEEATAAELRLTTGSFL